MAEILISLTIIGVIAAITLPALVGNINESAWRTQRKAFYSRLSQAIALMPSLNGYGVDPADDNKTAQNAAQTFVTDGLAKVLKITNVCDYNNLKKCGLPDSYKKFGGTKTNFPKKISEIDGEYMGSNPAKHVNTNGAGFETVNGESVAVFYNPFCVDKDVVFPGSDIWGEFSIKSVYPHVCAVFMFDLNGRKGPNKIGKDMWFINSLYPVEPSVVMFDPDKITKNNSSMTFDNAKQWCASQNARMANLDEGIANVMIGRITGTAFGWLGTDTGIQNRAYIITYNGSLIMYNMTSSNSVRCIKR